MAAAPATLDGNDKVLKTAQQIIKSLASTSSSSAAEDMIRIFSVFDNRLSSFHDLLSPSATADVTPSAAEEAALRLDAAESVIRRWDATDSILWASATPDDVTEFLNAVDDVIDFLGGAQHEAAENLLEIAMIRLGDEFRYLLDANSVPLDSNGLHHSLRRISLGSDVGDDDELRHFDSPVVGTEEKNGGSSLGYDRNFDRVDPDSIADLKGVADRMVLGGHELELGNVFCSVRTEKLDECLSVLGIDRMSIEEVQRLEWEVLDDKMKKWIQAVKIVVRVLYGEKRLCDEILSSANEEIRVRCFEETAKGCITTLLNFGDAVALCQRSSEKLFRILDMYETLADVLPDVQSLFSGNCKDMVYEEADGILKRLGYAARGTLAEFENAVRSETSRKAMHGGDIHPVTRYVMNYSKLLVVYSESLDLLLSKDQDSYAKGSVETIDAQNLECMTPFGVRLFLLISCLESKLEEKSKLYEDVALQFIFLMNNILYIVQKVKDSELGKILGNNWIRKRRGQIRQYATSYLRAAWTKVLSCLKDEGLGSGSGSSRGVSKVVLKEKFKSFNLAFEEIFRVQTTWKVPDPQLQEDLRMSISEKVIPAYRSFLGRYGPQLEGGRHSGKYLKYTADDLDHNLDSFFAGSTGLANCPKKST